jgi:hypothetical protein
MRKRGWVVYERIVNKAKSHAFTTNYVSPNRLSISNIANYSAELVIVQTV